jgi:hypothetical protein
VTVKDILIFWKVALFAGRYRNEGLGRSNLKAAVSPAAINCAGDSGCPKDAEEGNVVSMRQQSVCTRLTQERKTSRVLRGRVLRSVLRPVRVNPHYASLGQLGDGGADELASRLGKLGQPRGTNTGVGSTDVARLATLHRFARRGREVPKKRKEIEVSVPARIKSRQNWFGCSHVEKSFVAEVGRR